MIFTLKKYLFYAQTTKRYMSNNQTLCPASGLKRNPCSVTSLYLGARYKSPSGLKLSVNHCKQRLYKATNFLKQPLVSFPRVPAFSVDTQSGTQGRRLPAHNVFWQQKILKFFANRPIKIKIKLCNWCEPFELTWPLRKRPSNLLMLLVHLQNNLGFFCFQKTLRLDSLFSTVQIWVSAWQ